MIFRGSQRGTPSVFQDRQVVNDPRRRRDGVGIGPTIVTRGNRPTRGDPGWPSAGIVRVNPPLMVTSGYLMMINIMVNDG
jgi:hypothetical protein